MAFNNTNPLQVPDLSEEPMDIYDEDDEGLMPESEGNKNLAYHGSYEFIGSSNKSEQVKPKVVYEDYVYTAGFRFEKEFNLDNVQLLGSGGCGSVFKCYHKLDKLYYAIKVIQFVPATISAENTVREVSILAGLDHKNVIRYFGGWVEAHPATWLKTLHHQMKPSVPLGFRDVQIPDPDGSGFLFIQQALCETTLHTCLENRHTIDISTSSAIFLQVLQALAYIHSKDIIHRDLKPSNIFLDLSSNQIKVGDFGLATSLRGSLGPKTLTPGLGTHFYMSPEVRNSENYDHKADIYSLGIILFELFVIFGTGSERVDVLTKLISMDFSLVPNGFEKKQLLQEMLSHDPTVRPNASRILEDWRK